MRATFAILIAFALTFAMAAFAGNVGITNYSVTNGSTTVYKQVIASTPITVSQIYVCDTSGQVVKVATGLTTAAVDLFTAPVSACALFPVNPYLPAGTQINIEVGGTTAATTGYNAISLLP